MIAPTSNSGSPARAFGLPPPKPGHRRCHYAGCDNEFRPERSHTQKYCSPHCGKRGQRLIAAHGTQTPPCTICGQEFVPHGNGPLVCSQVCRDAHAIRKRRKVPVPPQVTGRGLKFGARSRRVPACVS